VALATGGTTAALIVLVVVIVVQQLDNDLLAPVVYGRSLELHPVIVLLAVAGGGALFGLPGTLLAVPVTAVGQNVLAEARRTPAEVPVEA
jgi:predicted PurR-regulated permease PerM